LHFIELRINHLLTPYDDVHNKKDILLEKGRICFQYGGTHSFGQMAGGTKYKMLRMRVDLASTVHNFVLIVCMT
jgi:hypothetical protein